VRHAAARIATSAAVVAAAAALSAASWPSAAVGTPAPRRASAMPVAHAAGTFVPDDPGSGSQPQGWEQLQWNFAGPFGVNAPEAWANAIAAGRAGAAGVTVAVLDTGVAYTNWKGYRRSPDFAADQFVRGYDFVAHDSHPLDADGHGTDVASTIAEQTNNGYGLTGLAYGARIMPVRVLDSAGDGDAAAIAAGIRFAARHGAKVINMSFNFDPGVRAAQIPQVLAAIGYARRRGAVLVAAAGNEAASGVAYPARDPLVIAVGATTEFGCLSSFSNRGAGLDLVAPGGGPDAALPGDPDCVAGRSGRSIYQVTLERPSIRRFGIGLDFIGTSMATPHVAAAAALVIATGAAGRHPSPAAVTARLERTARDLGAPGFDTDYGWGLLNAGAATAP
jgi:serine protease